MAKLLILLSIGLPWLGAVLVWLVGDQRSRLQHFLAVVFSLSAGITSLLLLGYASASPAWNRPFSSSTVSTAFGNLTFVPDGLGGFLAVIATVIGSLAVIFSIDYMRGEKQLGRYYAFVLFFIGAMVGLVLTGSLMLMFVFWEITALCSYALISFYNDDPKAVAGGIKALIMTQVGGIGLLFGAILCYTQLGTFEISALLDHFQEIPGNLLGLLAFGFLIAAASKSAQFPFQTWLPDAMEAPTPISALIHAATMVNAGVYLLARFYPAFEHVPGWRTAVVTVGVLSALLAAVMAMVATDLKRVLAYSTVSQLGYMVYAIGAGGVYASQYHLLSHAVFKALLFLSAGAVIHSVGTRDMRHMGDLGKSMPFTRVVFITGAFALAGIPIFNGFWSKEMVLEAGLQGGPLWAYLVMLFSACLTAFYTIRCVSMVFYGQSDRQHHVHDAGTAMKAALAPLAAATLVTWLLAGPLAKLFSSTLPNHEIHIESTWMVIEEVALAPATWIALLVITAGILAWFGRKLLTGIANTLKGIAWAAASSFGFEAVNRSIVQTTLAAAEKIRSVQTGLLSHNILGILSGLLFILILILFAGA